MAYCYNHRTTEGENTVESAWTLSRLSATLSWLEVHASVEECVVTSFRRMLVFPLYRHFVLCKKVSRKVLVLVGYILSL